MAIAKIVGVEPINYIRKKDGAEVSGITLYFTYKASSVWGLKCKEHYIGTNKPLFEQFLPFKDKPADLIGKEMDIDRDDNGFVENLVLRK